MLSKRWMAEGKSLGEEKDVLRLMRKMITDVY